MAANQTESPSTLSSAADGTAAASSHCSTIGPPLSPVTACDGLPQAISWSVFAAFNRMFASGQPSRRSTITSMLRAVCFLASSRTSTSALGRPLGLPLLPGANGITVKHCYQCSPLVYFWEGLEGFNTVPVRIGSLPSTCADTVIMVLNSLLRCGCGVNGEIDSRRGGAGDRVVQRATHPVKLSLAGRGLRG